MKQPNDGLAVYYSISESVSISQVVLKHKCLRPTYRECCMRGHLKSTLNQKVFLGIFSSELL